MTCGGSENCKSPDTMVYGRSIFASNILASLGLAPENLENPTFFEPFRGVKHKVYCY